MTSPWEARLDIWSNDAEVAASLRIPAVATLGLTTLCLEDAAVRLEQTLREIHIPTVQELCVLKKILGVGRAYAAKYHADERAHLATLYNQTLVPADPPTKMLTSLAGLGKSELAKTLVRLVGPARTVNLPDHGTAPMIGGIAIEIGAHLKLVDIINLVAAALGVKDAFTSSGAKSQERLKRLLYRAGCCFIVVDELQFLTMSASANAQVAKLLAYLRQFGVPIIFIGNYSLGHRLLKRPSEERQRLLLDPIILLPDLPNDTAFLELLEEYKVACAGTLHLDVQRDAGDVHWLTGGNKRMLRTIVVEAFRISKIKANKVRERISITMLEIREAYRSTAFQINRKEIDKLRQIFMGPTARNRSLDRDLICPFELSQEQVQHHERLTKVNMNAANAGAQLVAAFTAEERAGATRLKNEFGFDTPLPLPPKRSSVQRPKKTAEALRSGARADRP